MKNEELITEWLSYGKMDFDTAKYLHENMIPQPLEIICYHCQQSAEKALKAVLLSCDKPLSRTHDLGVLANQLADDVEIPEEVLDACDNLSPYGVKVRYPRELLVEKHHARQALQEAETIQNWCMEVLVNNLGQIEPPDR